MPCTVRRTLPSATIPASLLAALLPSAARAQAGPQGLGAGVWIIAETTDLPTKCAKIVVTNDAGRQVIPDPSRQGAEPNVPVRLGKLPLTTTGVTASAANGRAVKPVIRNYCASPQVATILRARATGRMGGSIR